jgi:sec-independent protein translocase protein TatC
LTYKDEEHFEQMSLGDHLEELRTRLLLSFIGILAGLIVCLFFGSVLIKTITVPYQFAVSKAFKAQLADPNTPDSTVQQTVQDQDLRKYPPSLQAIQPAETFLVYIKTCLIFGLILSSPWVFYHMWAFISAGLYPHEKKYVYIITPVSAGLFITGTVFFLLVVGPMAMLFFLKFDPGVDFVYNQWTFQKYVNFILMLTLVFGVAFQLPILVVGLEKLGIIPLSALKKARKYIILGLVVVGAMLTPPDVISQISLALPLYVLFEASLLFCKLTGKKKK